MKKLFNFALVALAAITFVSCGSKSPEDVIVTFEKLYNSGKIDEAMEYVCFSSEEEMFKSANIVILKERFAEALAQVDEYKLLDVSDVKVEMFDETTAYAFYNLKQSVNGQEIIEAKETYMFKTDKGWQVSFDSLKEDL